MKTYNTLEELVNATRCHFAQKTEFGWVARRTDKNSTHRLHFTFAYGRLVNRHVAAVPHGHFHGVPQEIEI